MFDLQEKDREKQRVANLPHATLGHEFLRIVCVINDIEARCNARFARRERALRLLGPRRKLLRFSWMTGRWPSMDKDHALDFEAGVPIDVGGCRFVEAYSSQLR